MLRRLLVFWLLLLRHRLLLLLLLGREGHEVFVMLSLKCGQGGRRNVHLVCEGLRGDGAGPLLLLLHHHHVLRRGVLMNNDDGGVHVRSVEVNLRVLKEVDLALVGRRNLLVLLRLLRLLLVMVIKCFTLQRLLRVFELLRLGDRQRLGGNFLGDRFRLLGDGLHLGSNFVLLDAVLTVGGRRRRRRRVVLLSLAVLLLLILRPLRLEVSASLDRVKEILQVLEIRLPGLLGGLALQEVEKLFRRGRSVLLVLGVVQLSATDSLGEVVDEAELFFGEFDGVVVAVAEVSADSGLGQLKQHVLNFKNLSQLLSFALGLLKLFLLLELLPVLVLLLDQGLELTRQLSGELQGLENLLVLGDGQLLVSVQLLAALAVGAVSVQLGLPLFQVSNLLLEHLDGHPERGVASGHRGFHGGGLLGAGVLAGDRV